MLDQNILHIQWVFLAIFGGLAILLAFFLSFMEYWRPREPEKAEIGEVAPAGKKWKEFFYIVPWILILTYSFTFLFTVIYTIVKIIFPPNW